MVSRATNEEAEGRSAIAAWAASLDLPLVVLFGSRARGTPRPGSDWDLAIWAERLPTPERRLSWSADLAAELAGPEAQLVFVTAELDPVLGFEIARAGRLLREREPGRWPVERLALWRRYLDAAPFLRAARVRLGRFGSEARVGA
jgi:predicted nucleotidyltransferase